MAASTDMYCTFKHNKCNKATLGPRSSSCFSVAMHKWPSACLCRSRIYKMYAGFKYHRFEFLTILIFIKSGWALFGVQELCRSSYCAGLFQHPRKPKIVQIQSKQTASHPSKFTRRAGFCKRFSQLKLPQDTTCSPATDILLSPLLSTASPPAAKGNKKPVPTSL